MNSLYRIVLVLIFAALTRTGAAADASSVLQARCFACHSGAEVNGNVDLSQLEKLPSLKARYSIWRKVIDQMDAGTMPPETEKPLTDEEKSGLRDEFHKLFDTSQNLDPGPQLTRQLTRSEYAQTIRDLLSISFDAAEAAGIPAEPVSQGFANRSESQSFDATLMEKYFVGADDALDNLFTNAKAESARTKLLAAAPDNDAGSQQSTRAILAPFLKRAYRRPVAAKEVERFALISDAALAQGDDLPNALEKAMMPILVSPEFLLRIEQPPIKQGTLTRVSDHELAVRLSYFLWGTMPDNELTAVADAGTLSQPEILELQTRRMLKDPRASALTREMLESWLQLSHLKKALPNQNHFPTFTWSLRQAMGEETRLFCESLRTEDRSILEFLNADYTFVNAELAKHYGLTPPPGKEFVKIQLQPENHRGGLLGMGSVLAMTSHSDRTKPTARGKWILEVLLGTPPPPPPANAGNFAPPDKARPEPKSFREKLGQHASDPNCVACHKRIDPLGFALENYDAIGHWRDGTAELPVDNAGQLPGIGEFSGVDGLRNVLQSRQPQFVRNFVAKTLTYALGRDLSYYDEPTIQQITADLERNDFRFSTVILGVVQSVPFQYCKAVGAE
ncbi:DUF1592 domain-containing protein [Planctomicrobium piriforme]|uniref:DUF1592 domain-containing protein n=1 Tax=Planctomicrobium piriforme TaxID=1576369 RepID=UPI001113D9F0|nr:DUF1592 domain-containing protein [Planctomicrobium piriforme]